MRHRNPRTWRNQGDNAFKWIPPEIVQYILLMPDLSPTDVARFSSTCKIFHQRYGKYNDPLWQTKIKQYLQSIPAQGGTILVPFADPKDADNSFMTKLLYSPHIPTHVMDIITTPYTPRFCFSSMAAKERGRHWNCSTCVTLSGTETIKMPHTLMKHLVIFMRLAIKRYKDHVNDDVLRLLLARATKAKKRSFCDGYSLAEVKTIYRNLFRDPDGYIFPAIDNMLREAAVVKKPKVTTKDNIVFLQP